MLPEIVYMKDVQMRRFKLCFNTGISASLCREYSKPRIECHAKKNGSTPCALTLTLSATIIYVHQLDNGLLCLCFFFMKMPI